MAAVPIERLSGGEDVENVPDLDGLRLCCNHASKETQQNATDTLSSYKRDGLSVLLHDEHLKEVTRRNPYMRDER
jgi:hypothetical protein